MLNLELSSFAKDLTGLKVALESGADSVYIGGQTFGMDTISNKFSMEELEEGIKFSHERNKKVYVTISLLPHNNDFVKLEEYLLKLNDIKVDGLILCEPGTLEIVRKVTPNMKVHMGIQANIYNYETARFYYDLGVKRVVIAKELALKDIIEIRKNAPLDLEIEAFVHGSMVMSYSGRRLLSNYMTSKDAGKYDEEKHYNLVEEKRPGQYCPIYEDEGGTIFYGAKDLCMIEFIPELIKSGVTTLTIEGHLKSNEYTEKVMKIYRKAIDEFINNPDNWQFDKNWLEELKNIDHRDLTTGFYLEENIDYTK
ncbi:MAG: peptidase U32 family protein [Terrisporobacter othiniensis]|uniref:peptidase U32 family protein n=1 Tax=Terrisporobacter petrolearius TaxID=1460447 RepID=UPI0022E33D64|nr:peptidase U32 family protein [Terrisporobacter petrolearius]MDU4859578.1 peptidase U32 family protein [Terrisporobacter othiniensis]MDU6993965.1 peptidase U32 family protein [Terrisporobacter othiniensis]